METLDTDTDSRFTMNQQYVEDNDFTETQGRDNSLGSQVVDTETRENKDENHSLGSQVVDTEITENKDNDNSLGSQVVDTETRENKDKNHSLGSQVVDTEITENKDNDNSLGSQVVDTETDIMNYDFGDETNQHYRFYDDDDENFEHYYEDEEFYNYGDGLDEWSFEGTKGVILDLIAATTRLNGRIQEDAEQYLLELLSVCSSDQRKELMKVQSWKHTPLSLACEKGNLKVVKFLVEECGADVNEFNGWPLYWAIIKRQPAIVLYLVDHSADVSACLHDNFNMLMVALGISFNIFPKSVQDSEKSGNEIKKDLVLMENHSFINKDIVDILIDHGAVEKCDKRTLYRMLTNILSEDKEIFLKVILNKIPDVDDIRNREGTSVLDFAISESNLYGITVLTEHGADINACRSDFLKLRSITVDERCNDIETNINQVLESYLNKDSKQRLKLGNDQFIHPVVYAAHIGNAKLLYHLLALSEIPIRDKLDALELIGAYFVIKFQNLSQALVCWNSAMDIRMGKDVFITAQAHVPDGSLNVPFIVNLTSYHAKKDKKENLEKAIILKPRRAFDFLLEYQSKEDLDALTPYKNLEIRIHASLLYERLIGYGHTFTICVLAILAKKFMHDKKIDAFIALTTYSLPCFIKFGKKVPENVIRTLVNSMYKVMTKKDMQLFVNFDIILAFLKCIFLVCFKHNSRYQSCYMNILLFAISTLIQMEKTDEQDYSFRRFLRILIKVDLRDAFKQTLLHHCVLIPKRETLIDEEDEPLLVATDSLKKGFDEPVKLLHLLLELGANPNTLDIHGQTPLQTFFHFPNPYPPERKIILGALLEAGSHPDLQDYGGNTAITKSYGTSLQLCQVADRTLQCLAARVIIENKISYSDQLTPHLEQFVTNHKRHVPSVIYNHVNKYFYGK